MKNAKKIAVLYTSKTGFVKKYAEWIAKELSADIFEAKKMNLKKMMPYDVIIYGGRLHASGITGVKLITKNYEKLKGKMILVWGTGASPYKDTIIEELKKHNLKGEMYEKIPLFYMRGGFIYNKLPLSDKILMTLLKWSILSKKRQNKPLSSDEKGMLESFYKPQDFTDMDFARPLIEYIRKSA